MDRPSSGSIFGGELGRLAASGRSIRPVATHPQWAEADVRQALLCPKWGKKREGLDESVVRVPPGRTGCIMQDVRARFDSSIADFDSGHRALSLRRKELGREVRRGCATRSSASHAAEMDAALHPPKPWNGGAHPSHEGLSGRGQVHELVARTVVPRSCV